MGPSRIAFPALGVAALLVGAAACRPAPVPQAQPSPLLDALGLAAPALTGSRCRPDRLLYRGERLYFGWDWPRALAAVTGRVGTTCVLFSEGATPNGEQRRVVARVSLDPDGIIADASRTVYGLRATEAAAAVDSVLARGRRLPGARPVRCAPFADADGRPVPRHGWEAPAYTAAADVLHAQPQSEVGYAWQLTVGRGRLAQCTGVGEPAT
jgi:hypothetical protein